ncbi:MAG: hypothetical protein H6574_18875 [Lewinellaceae bacterium]|nr:hypothetical protein [Lewinellaceae bacterium]
MDERTEGSDYQRLHHFISDSPWPYKPVLEAVGRDMSELLRQRVNQKDQIDIKKLLQPTLWWFRQNHGQMNYSLNSLYQVVGVSKQAVHQYGKRRVLFQERLEQLQLEVDELRRRIRAVVWQRCITPFSRIL